MAKKKFYAVKGSLEKQIFSSWDECSRAVKGKSGAIFKGFPSLAEAQAWLDDTPEEAPEEVDAHIYVDGSFSPKCPFAGWGVVVVQGDQKHSYAGLSENPALSRNIDGELLAAQFAIDWCRENKCSAVIYHDYEGIARWALGEWKASSEVAQAYCRNIQPLPENLWFKKVKAHSGHELNDLADELASSAIKTFLEKNNG